MIFHILIIPGRLPNNIISTFCSINRIITLHNYLYFQTSNWVQAIWKTYLRFDERKKLTLRQGLGQDHFLPSSWIGLVPLSWEDRKKAFDINDMDNPLR